MTASDYQITFPYGATSAPYSPVHPHRGDDRPCPTGTPVVISGTQVGLSGATGNVTGPHLHIQEWINSYSNTRKPKNAFQLGTVVNIDPTGTQGDGSFGKFITVQTSDGWNDTYCHLSQINVKVGDKIGNIMTNPTVATMRIAESELKGGDYDYIHSGKFDAQLKAAWSTAEVNDFIYNSFVDPQSSNYRQNKIVWRQFYDQYHATAPAMAQTIAAQNEQVKTLTAQLALQSDDTKNLNALGQALQWFVKRVGLK